MGSLLWLFTTIIGIVIWIIIIQAILSWLVAFNILNIHQPLVRQVWFTLNNLTEPIYRPIRRVLPNMGGIDLSPMVVVVGLMFLERLVLEMVQGGF